MADSPTAVFEIRKIYTKDISFESPKAPGVFLENSKNPNIDMQVTIVRNALEPEDYFEVILKLTATAQVEESPLFLIEIEQAGVFQIKGITGEKPRVSIRSCIAKYTIAVRQRSDIRFGYKGRLSTVSHSPDKLRIFIQTKEANSSRG